MKTAVVGGSGFIGRHLVALLVDAGHEVRSIDRRPGTDHPVGVTSHTPQHPADFKDVFKGCNAVFHLAARSGGIGRQGTNHHAVFAYNTSLTGSVLTAAVETGSRVFLASSAVVYRSSTSPLSETDPLLGFEDRPNGYAWSKICDEMSARWMADAASEPIVVGRFTNIYGPGGHGRDTVLHDLVERALTSDRDFQVWGDGSAVRSFLAVQDAAAAIMQLGLEADEGTYNIDAGEETSIAAVADQIAAAVGTGVRPRFEPDRPSGAPYRVLDSSKVRATGWRPTLDFSSGIRALVDHERARIQAG